jgi:hypothetical protein
MTVDVAVDGRMTVEIVVDAHVITDVRAAAGHINSVRRSASRVLSKTAREVCLDDGKLADNRLAQGADTLRGATATRGDAAVL